MCLHFWLIVKPNAQERVHFIIPECFCRGPSLRSMGPGQNLAGMTEVVLHGGSFTRGYLYILADLC